jgi:hypothetical protein
MSKRTIIILVIAIALVAAAGILIAYQLKTARITNVESLQNVIAPTATPHVSFVLIKTAKGNTIVVNWSDLPAGTTELNIFLSLASQKIASSTIGGPEWTLWKTIPIAPGETGGGSFGIDVGTETFSGSSFYAEAVGSGLGTGGNPGANSTSTGSGGTPEILWTSSSTFSVEPTSTTVLPPLNQPVSPPVATSTNPNQVPQTGTVPPNPTSTPTVTPTSTSPVIVPPNPIPTSTGNPTESAPPNGIPYYTPQGKLSGYGFAPTGNFWVNNVNRSIEIGWQNLPAGFSSVAVLRSTTVTGPWEEILTQADPAPSSTYSLQLIDNSVNTPFYYEMTAASGTETVATYGPIYLTP